VRNGEGEGRTRLQREKERGEGSKEVSDLLTVYANPGVPATSQEFPKWQSRHYLPSLSLSPPYFALLSNLLSSAVASPLSTFTLPPLLLLLLHVGVLHVVYPFRESMGFTFV